MKITISRESLVFTLLMGLISAGLFAQAENTPSVEAQLEPTLRYSTKVIDRGTLPVGIVSVTPKVKLSKHAEFSIGSEFGITKGWAGRFGYDGFELTHYKMGFKAKRTINIGSVFDVYSNSFMVNKFEASLPIHILDGEIIRDVTIGTPVVFYNHMMAGGILSDVLTLTMRENVAAKLDFNFWYGVQVTDSFWADVSSSLGTVDIKNPKNQATTETSWIWKKPSASINGIYVINPYVDVSANFGADNFREFNKTMKMGLSMTLRGGKIFG